MNPQPYHDRVLEKDAAPLISESIQCIDPIVDGFKAPLSQPTTDHRFDPIAMVEADMVDMVDAFCSNVEQQEAVENQHHEAVHISRVAKSNLEGLHEDRGCCTPCEPRTIEENTICVIQSSHEKNLDVEDCGTKIGEQGSLKKPRGRPKKCSNHKALPPKPTLRNSDEVQHTSETTKALGVSSTNEEAVLHELRKSKRLQLLEVDAD
ncbi:unnamed protein product [Amaranthus hypochondriacus]